MSDLLDISRLREAQEKVCDFRAAIEAFTTLSLSNCNDMIEKWKKFREDYKSVQKLLTDLPKKTTYDIMVPIGPLAFMPGKLVHTNEIMVLLGDNWFAERSASQAVDIANRRLISVEDYLSKLHKEHENILSHMAFASDISSMKNQNDYQEIKEELTDKDRQRQDLKKTGRVAHARARKGSVKKVSLQSANKPGKPITSEDDKDLFTRLDELEKQEMSGKELENELYPAKEDTVTESITNHTTTEAKHPQLKHKPSKTQSEDYMTIETNQFENQKLEKKVSWKHNIVEEQSKDSVTPPRDGTPTINFTHSAFKVSRQGSPSNEELINSPAEIFTRHLKSTSESTGRKQPLAKNKGEDSDVQAISDVVVENRDMSNLEMLANNKDKNQKAEPRKVSKFKARRMKNDS